MQRSMKHERDESDAGSTSTESEDDLVGPAAVPASIDTPIDASNKGAAMLRKMGYTGTGGLGHTILGRAEPVPFLLKIDQLGLGRAERDDDVLAKTTTKKPDIRSVQLLRETEEDRVKREAKVADQARLAEELAATLKSYYCEPCDKGYRNIRLYNDHLQSYDHHHKKRFKEMQANQRATAAASGDVDKRREKERKREAKELARMGLAGGLVEAAPSIDGAPMTVDAPVLPSEAPPRASGFKKLGAPTTAPPVFAPIASTSTLPPEVAAPVTVSASAPRAVGSAPAFQRAGYTVLETGSTPLLSPRTDSTPRPQEWRPENAPPLHPLLADATFAPPLTTPTPVPLSLGRSTSLAKSSMPAPSLARPNALSMADDDDDDDADLALAAAGRGRGRGRGMPIAPKVGGIKLAWKRPS